MTNRDRMLLGGFIVFMCIVTLRPAYSSDRMEEEAERSLINQAAVAGDDARLEYPAGFQDAAAAAAMHKAGNEEQHCNYLSAAPHSSDKTFRFADGNQVVFSAMGKNRIQFDAVDGATTQIEDGDGVARKNWWCQEDGVVLFRTVQAADGKLSGVKVEWLDSRGAHKAETQVNIAPSGDKVVWSYESSRLVDDCLGLTFRVQREKDAAKRAKLVEYRLCPKGI